MSPTDWSLCKRIGSFDMERELVIPAPNPISLKLTHFDDTAVRSRMTGLAGIPATFRLCSVGREFKTTVAAFNSPNATPIAGESHLYEGGDAIETAGHATQQPSPADLFAAETTELAKSPMLVRRLTEVPSAGNDKALGTMSDWSVLSFPRNCRRISLLALSLCRS